MEDVKIKLTDGTIVVASDGHYWPEKKASTAHRALVWCLQTKPDAFIFNGDAFDCSTISKHPPIGWQDEPTLLQQMNATKKRLGELRAAMGMPKEKCIWVYGNHDRRFNKKLASSAKEFKGIAGLSLEEHFPGWVHTDRVDIVAKEKCVVIHQLSGGQNPLKQNLMKAGCHIVTGHHHNQNVLAQTGYDGTKYAVDAGMLARVDGPQFSYGEAAPVNWRSGFVILRWEAGKMLPPTLVTVLDEKKGVIWCNGKDHVV